MLLTTQERGCSIAMSSGIKWYVIYTDLLIMEADDYLFTERNGSGTC